MAQNPDGCVARSGSDSTATSKLPSSDGCVVAPVTDLSAVRRDRRPGHGTQTADAGPTVAARKVANRRFDIEKVARLKCDIEAGRYQIDPFSIADRFIEHERNGR